MAPIFLREQWKQCAKRPARRIKSDMEAYRHKPVDQTELEALATKNFATAQCDNTVDLGGVLNALGSALSELVSIIANALQVVSIVAA